MRVRRLQHATAAIATTLACGIATAGAHPGHLSYGLAGGFAHPFSGVDHLLSMVAVGLWAVQLGGAAIVLLPASFVSVMVLGGVAAKLGLHIGDADPFITASLFALGLLVATAARLPTAVGCLLVGSFAFFHGYAHVREGVIEQGHGMLGFAIGFVAATLVLHAAGVALGLLMRRPRGVRLMRLAGAGIAAVAVMIEAGWVQT